MHKVIPERYGDYTIDPGSILERALSSSGARVYLMDLECTYAGMVSYVKRHPHNLCFNSESLEMQRVLAADPIHEKLFKYAKLSCEQDIPQDLFSIMNVNGSFRHEFLVSIVQTQSSWVDLLLSSLGCIVSVDYRYSLVRGMIMNIRRDIHHSVVRKFA